VWGVDNESAAESLLELRADPEAALTDEEANFRRLLDAELQRISAFYEKKVPHACDLALNKPAPVGKQYSIAGQRCATASYDLS